MRNMSQKMTLIVRISGDLISKSSIYQLITHYGINRNFIQRKIDAT